MNKALSLIFILMFSYIFSNCAKADTSQNNAELFDEVQYWVSKLNDVGEGSQITSSVPVNQEAYDKLVALGKPAVVYIVKLIDEGGINNLNIYIILQDITGEKIEYGLQSKEGPELYLQKIKKWLRENGHRNTTIDDHKED